MVTQTRLALRLATLLLSLCLCQALNATYEGDVSALLVFKRDAAYNGALPSWEEGTDPCGSPDCRPGSCNWRGVGCTGWRVMQLQLNCVSTGGCGLGGPLPPELAQLDQLAVISLQRNRFTGGLPPAWASLANLQVLDVSGNDLSETLPVSYGYGNLSSLQQLDVSANRIPGFLPASWGNLTSLVRLDLSYNLLGGPLPADWTQLMSLVYLSLESNDLTNTVPFNWISMKALRMLNLADNCGVCGMLPPFKQTVSTNCPADSSEPCLTVLARGSSLGWACSSSNCSSFPLGFVGQAAIVLAVVMLMTTMCCWRRCYMFRRHGQREEDRRGWGLVRGVFSMRRAPRPQQHGEEEAGGERDDGEGSPPAKVEPPIVVVMPDGTTLCTAKLDPGASLPPDGEAPSEGSSPKAPSQGAGGGAQAPGAQTGNPARQQPRGLARWLPWRRSGGAGAPAAAAAPAVAAAGGASLPRSSSSAFELALLGSSPTHQQQLRNLRAYGHTSGRASSSGALESGPGAAAAHAVAEGALPSSSGDVAMRGTYEAGSSFGGGRDREGPGGGGPVRSSRSEVAGPSMHGGAGAGARTASRARRSRQPHRLIPVYDVELGPPQ